MLFPPKGEARVTDSQWQFTCVVLSLDAICSGTGRETHDHLGRGQQWFLTDNRPVTGERV